MNLLGTVHVTFSIVALLAGAIVLLRRKGGAWHRRLGWIYVAGMVGLNGTAFMIYRLFGTFGPFHIAALLSFVTVIMGTLPAWRRQPREQWLDRHYYWMTWSYVGLLAAAGSETATRLPESPFWWMVLLATAPIVALGAVLIRRQASVTLPRIRTAIGIGTHEPEGDPR